MKTDSHQALISQLQLALVSQQDCLELWQWRNDSHTRAMSLKSDVVKYDVHCRWFESVLNDPSQHLYIATIADWNSSQELKKIGMVRFDVLPIQALDVGDTVENAASTALVSINLNPECRGKSLSVPLLKKALDIFASTVASSSSALAKVNCIKAVVKPSNTASLKCFKAAGFIQTSDSPTKVLTINKDCVFLLTID
ncbi:MAG: ribosomal protein S18 acetylase RimI-like enzyme [Glaciecola sp.]|jgi:ribosomal protein S18 acetylase RimI-like enzyme